jgi:hypothetical protein
VFKIFDEYANILKGMYSTRFNGCPKDSVQTDSTQVDSPQDSVPSGPMSPLVTSLKAWRFDNIRSPKEKEKKGDGYQLHEMTHNEHYL